MSSDPLRLLLATTLAVSVVIPLLYLLRAPLRHWLGAGAAYASWLCVPIAVIAVMLPAREAPADWSAMGRVLQPMRAATAAAVPAMAPTWQAFLLAAWFGGMLVMVAWLWSRQRRFVHGLGALRRREDGLWMADASRGLPAAMGLFRARVVVPADFESRYLAQERVLIACHERLHVRRGDLIANAVVSALRCIYWFNPVIHLAARRFRIDQELACDEGVIRRHPAARRAYGEAMLKAQLDVAPVPLACHWPAPHPLRERIGMLGKRLPSTSRRVLAALLIAAMATTAGYGAWAAQPARPPAMQDGLYHVAMQVSLDGTTRAFEIREQSGKAFAVSGKTDAGMTWRGVFRIDPVDARHARVSTEIEAAGKPVGSPELRVELGRLAGIGVGGGNGGTPVSVDLLITRVRVDASPPVAGPHPMSRRTQPIDYSKLAPPRYPPSRHEGTVMMRLVIGVDGRVTQVGLERGSGFADLDEAAMAAARGWLFEPAIEAGRAVASTVRVPVEFALDEPGAVARQDAPAPNDARMGRR